jgi:hypothetical protein
MGNRFVVVDEHAGSNVLRIYQDQCLPTGIPHPHPDGRGHCGHRPRPEQPQLNPTSEAGCESCCGSARRYCAGKASRAQDATNGSSGMVIVAGILGRCQLTLASSAGRGKPQATSARNQLWLSALLALGRKPGCQHGWLTRSLGTCGTSLSSNEYELNHSIRCKTT